ncbi:MAG: virulence RhuM family protein [Defluviitaleaceae bacterium]|nr:virulence RhuM family protein [Defluviitaleaceae bacterium]
MEKHDTLPTRSEIIMYLSDDGKTKVDVIMEGETVWLTQTQMAELFQTTKQNISLHINNAFKEGELEKISVVKEYLTTASDGKNYIIKYYNLDMIISVGYRVKSLRGTQFRRWALTMLREYLIKGFVMNDDLLKKASGGNYWHELLARIRDIRSSEKMMYRQVLDLYATSVDYDPKTPESREFFKIVQNKIHYAAHGHTAAEVISRRANADLPNMGMTVFAGEIPTRSDVGIAKNYLTRDELDMLNRMVSAFFDLAELRAMQHRPIYMKDWVTELDDFAARYGKGLLSGAGTVSHKTAINKAEAEFEKYRKQLVNELSPVERDYIASIKNAQKKLERAGDKI